MSNRSTTRAEWATYWRALRLAGAHLRAFPPGFPASHRYGMQRRAAAYWMQQARFARLARDRHRFRISLEEAAGCRWRARALENRGTPC